MSIPLELFGAMLSLLVIEGIILVAQSDMPQPPKRRSSRNRGDEENTKTLTKR